MSLLQDVALGAFKTIAGHSTVNKFLINRIVNRCRTRPHPWSTKHDYISWSGMTDKTFSARLLPAKPYPPNEVMGTRRPPIGDVAQLFASGPNGQRVCGKSTSLFPAFAQYLTDGFLRTVMNDDAKHPDRKKTTSNHEIDLSPLYGRIPAQTDVLRSKQGGRLKTQTIAGEEFPPYLYDANGQVKAEFCDSAGVCPLDLPLGVSHTPTAKPETLFAVGGDRANATLQVSMMNTLFLREHNRIAGELAKQNNWDDERLFETARNIVIFLFIKIVVEEYINHINSSGFSLRADPTICWEAHWNRPNWMTAEFSLLYRWHSLIPETMRWEGQTVPTGSMLLNNERLIEKGLVHAFAETSATPATQLGLGNSASFLVGAEAKAAEQARTVDLASYNDYRRVMKMDPAKSFEELVGKSKDPVEQARRTALAARLKALYGHIDNLEYYVGLFAEPVGRNGPLPELISAMVAMDAFSQALTNPLLSQHVWDQRDSAFTPLGVEIIRNTGTLKDVLARNSSGLNGRFVGMTRQDWKRD